LTLLGFGMEKNVYIIVWEFNVVYYFHSDRELEGYYVEGDGDIGKCGCAVV
jgi:hypothetical protein